MKLLLHICCGPCATALVESLRAEGHELSGFFYNPNLYPPAEQERRRAALRQFSESAALPVIWEEGGLPTYLKHVAFAPENRCFHCYRLRLDRTAERAAAEGFQLFSTTLLISPYQDLEAIKQAGELASRRHGAPFLFRDFRSLYRSSRERSRELGLYRQSYCGCFFSQLERARARAATPAGGGPQ
jgi:hypothetical protein